MSCKATMKAPQAECSRRRAPARGTGVRALDIDPDRRKRVSRWLAGFVVAILTIVAGHATTAMPKADLWPRWAAHDPDRTSVIDHGSWSRFLARYRIIGQNGVSQLRYGEVSAADRRALDSYLETLAAVAISAFRRPEQLAYWVNLYNALTVKVLLDSYPVASIRDIGISPGWFTVGPWRKKLIRVEGQELSLDDIEHRILRPIWRDPRIHYVVSCASTGCPNLGRDAYTGATIEATLTDAARQYVNGGRGVMFDGGELYVSSIYKWFREDFGGSDPSVIAHLRSYAEPALAARLSRARDIAGHFYDWSLNNAN